GSAGRWPAVSTKVDTYQNTRGQGWRPGRRGSAGRWPAVSTKVDTYQNTRGQAGGLAAEG
ncbi:TPA: hypothetical protein ACOEOH_002787, partial [Stenotrophomonas maltophilia]